MTAPLLGITPSFMLSGTTPALYTTIQAIVDMLPAVPSPSLGIELPLSILDGFTRAFLLCNLVPPTVTAHTSPIVANSPWTLLLTSLISPNGGFFMTNLFSFLHPTPLTLTTPAELRPYGWTTTDLWCAPLITALYALLTHAQPFWADLHVLIIEFLSGEHEAKFIAKAVDPEVARAICTLVLIGLFTTRTVKNFTGPLTSTLIAAKTGSSLKSLSSASLKALPPKPPSVSTRNKSEKTKIQ